MTVALAALRLVLSCGLTLAAGDLRAGLHLPTWPQTAPGDSTRGGYPANLR